VVHIYNPRYLGGGDRRITVQGQGQFRVKVSKTLSQKQADVVTYAYNPTYSRGRDKVIVV
jgi:hypothetical protein